MHKLSEANLTLSKEKCEFGMDEITFMGHVLSEHGIGPTEERVKDLANAERPRSISEVKSFLGLVNFSGRFIKELATKAHPLRELTKQNATFEWTEKEENSFQELKNSLTSSSCLGYFSLTAEKTLLITDASNVGLGAMLVQENQGVCKVICYASRSLTDVERRYSTTEKEALAAVWACEKFHMYLYTVNFELIVDHKALEFIFSPKCWPSARVQRWAIRLMPYNFKVRPIPGKENAADALSRLLPKPSMDEEKQNTNKTEEYIKLIL
ncbi:hypothetical protein RRG08_013749 [Elysia crispata]|uniref:Reverse transcriptase RNase H-like domain-containing protein n=1 Tax=Elysia crispata TaxID=231223 RepID=A0AAE1DJV1_9GAST|nr:hypothetical protein RRG08_013749 [Elysia crispata]